MEFTPYLNFDGTCAEAFRFYGEVFGGTPDIRTHGDSPIADQVAPEWHDRVLHARLEVDGAVLMASDTPPDEYEPPRGTWVAIQLDDTVDAERIFEALADGGRVTMPLESTFWAARFGMLVDRYGIAWMVSAGG
ncbi:MAG: VOC family protein [Gemmatimonadota bacterium]